MEGSQIRNWETSRSLKFSGPPRACSVKFLYYISPGSAFWRWRSGFWGDVCQQPSHHDHLTTSASQNNSGTKLLVQRLYEGALWQPVFKMASEEPIYQPPCHHVNCFRIGSFMMVENHFAEIVKRGFWGIHNTAASTVFLCIIGSLSRERQPPYCEEVPKLYGEIHMARNQGSLQQSPSVCWLSHLGTRPSIPSQAFRWEQPRPTSGLPTYKRPLARTTLVSLFWNSDPQKLCELLSF